MLLLYIHLHPLTHQHTYTDPSMCVINHTPSGQKRKSSLLLDNVLIGKMNVEQEGYSTEMTQMPG